MACSSLRPRAISHWCIVMPMWQKPPKRSMLPWHKWRIAKAISSKEPPLLWSTAVWTDSLPPQREEVPPHRMGWEAGEQVWRRVENLSQKSPKDQQCRELNDYLFGLDTGRDAGGRYGCTADDFHTECIVSC